MRYRLPAYYSFPTLAAPQHQVLRARPEDGGTGFGRYSSLLGLGALLPGRPKMGEGSRSLGFSPLLSPHLPLLSSVLPQAQDCRWHLHYPGIIVCGQDSLLGKSAIPELCLGMGLAIEAAPLSALT